MSRFRNAFERIAACYQCAVAESGGPSLARVATIVVNRGSFFTALSAGKGCTLQNFEKFVDWFAERGNWPDNRIPALARDNLHSLGISIPDSLSPPDRSGSDVLAKSERTPVFGEAAPTARGG